MTEGGSHLVPRVGDWEQYVSILTRKDGLNFNIENSIYPGAFLHLGSEGEYVGAELIISGDTLYQLLTVSIWDPEKNPPRLRTFTNDSIHLRTSKKETKSNFAWINHFNFPGGISVASLREHPVFSALGREATSRNTSAVRMLFS